MTPPDAPRFRLGTVEVPCALVQGAVAPDALIFDKRSGNYRCRAADWANVSAELGVPAAFGAPHEQSLACVPAVNLVPRDYQSAACDAWWTHAESPGRGVVALPTGSGKSLVGAMCIERAARPALVIAPTLDLVWQWHGFLRARYRCPVGVVTGNEYDVQPLTVTTYDSAALRMERLGDRFGLVVFDECHHLPTPSHRLAAEMSLAPYRLGLSATPERQDGLDALSAVLGPVCFRQRIGDLKGGVLAEYETQIVKCTLTDEEREAYTAERAIYLSFLRRQGISMRGPNGWGTFIQRAARTDEGRRALLAHRRQKELAEGASEKRQVVQDLLFLHRHDKAIVFTDDNKTAYGIAEDNLIPAITHQTKVSERTRILEMLRAGDIGAVVTSRVLNEGVDVPSAKVAIVVSGTGTIREHVQRLGRILRRTENGDAALLYELISSDTTERQKSARRRNHDAYR